MRAHAVRRGGWRDRVAALAGAALPAHVGSAFGPRLRSAVGVAKQWPWVQTLATLRGRFQEDRLALTAGSLTFTTTIALVPLATVMLAAFSAFPIFGQFQGSLQKYFLQTLVPDAIARPVLGALTSFASQANRLGTVGLLVLVITALMLMLTIDRTLNQIWRVRKPRPIAQRVLVYWAAVTLGPLLLGMSLSITSYALSASRGWVGAMPGSIAVLLNVLEFVLLAAAMAGLFHYVPNTDVRWRHAWAGGLFVSAGFELAKRVLAWYLALVPTYSTIYGAFATVPIFLVWLYLGWVIVLLGAVIAAYAPAFVMRLVRRPDLPGERFTLAVQLLRSLRRARDDGRRGLSATQLSAELRTDPLQIEPLLDTLVALDWVGRLDEADQHQAPAPGERRHVLLADPQHTAASPLLAALLLAPAPALRGFWQRAGLAEMSLQDVLDA